MSKKLMLLAAGALTALAFVALPSVAAAGEWECERFNSEVCGAFTGSSNLATALTQDPRVAGELVPTIICISNSTTGKYTNQTTVEEVAVTFKTCGYGSSECHSAGQAGGVIKTFDLVAHNVQLEKTPAVSPLGVLLTPNPKNNEFATITCGGSLVTHVKGNGVIGENTTRKCGEKDPATVETQFSLGSLVTEGALR
jgi:hypothetical protein